MRFEGYVRRISCDELLMPVGNQLRDDAMEYIRRTATSISQSVHGEAPRCAAGAAESVLDADSVVISYTDEQGDEVLLIDNSDLNDLVFKQKGLFAMHGSGVTVSVRRKKAKGGKEAGCRGGNRPVKDLIRDASVSQLAEALFKKMGRTFRGAASGGVEAVVGALEEMAAGFKEENAPAGDAAVHAKVTCDVCGTKPIVGARNKSLTHPDFDVCDACLAKDPVEAKGHVFVKLATEEASSAMNKWRKLAGPQWSKCAANAPTAASYKGAVKARTLPSPAGNAAVHATVTCDVCGTKPIVGARNKSLTHPDFDVCDACLAKDPVEAKGHVFVKLATEEASSAMNAWRRPRCLRPCMEERSGERLNLSARRAVKKVDNENAKEFSGLRAKALHEARVAAAAAQAAKPPRAVPVIQKSSPLGTDEENIRKLVSSIARSAERSFSSPRNRFLDIPKARPASAVDGDGAAPPPGQQDEKLQPLASNINNESSDSAVVCQQDKSCSTEKKEVASVAVSAAATTADKSSESFGGARCDAMGLDGPDGGADGLKQRTLFDVGFTDAEKESESAADSGNGGSGAGEWDMCADAEVDDMPTENAADGK